MVSITLDNKTGVEDEAILAFIERVYNSLGLTSNVSVKVTQTRTLLCPGAEMYTGSIFPPKGFKERADCYVWLRLPSPKVVFSLSPSFEASKAENAAEWFEHVVRHEFTHVWQFENLPHWNEDWFRGYNSIDSRLLGSRRRQAWSQRPVEVDCNRRMKEVEAVEGTEDHENVKFYKEYLANELIGG